MTTKKVISVLESRTEFINLLKVNPGLIIIKFGATWCGPCKQIKHVVDAFFATSPPSVICADLDIDESFDLYAYLKSKRMVNGIPAIVCYKKDNMTFIPDDSVTGADPAALAAFFKRCNQHLNNIIKSGNASNKNTITEVRT
jgi:thioredoxin-like negative regulator of GroEL